MKKEICVFGESYTTEELWFDDEVNQFSIKQYHWGVVDDEEHYDGETEVDTFTVLKKMIAYNKLREVLRYYNELEAERNLDAVLQSMEQKSWIRNYDLLADGHCKYYEISEKEYAIYYEKTFFSVTDHGEGVADFTVVRRILENRETVIYSEYVKNSWVSSSF